MEFVLILFAFISGVAGVILARKICLALVSCRWEVVQATIVGTSHEETSDSEFYPKYIPEICYTYSVNGKTFHGKTYEFLKTHYTKDELDSILNSFHAGGEVDIRVNPLKPWQSVIVNGTQPADFIALAGCMFMCFSALYAIL